MKMKNFLKIQNLSFEYFRRDENEQVTDIIEALKDVSFDVEQGQFIAILGRNGSGKSTLAKHINALLLPSEGTVVVDGMDTEDEELRLQIRKTAGMVFQNPDNQIVAGIVEEDVAFGPENLGVATGDIWNRVNKALEWTKMEKYRHKSPNHLSGGQKQRVAIAGILAMEPKCIIFDEATAMLDPAGRKKVVEIAKQLQQERNITILFITHHMDEVMYADQVYVMKDGCVIDSGSPKEIFARKDMLDQCGLQLPAFYEYAMFLREAGIMPDEAFSNIENKEQLIDWLVNNYRKQAGTAAGNATEDYRQFGELKPNEAVTGLLLNNVCHIYNKGYAEETYALKDINVYIEKGEFVAVVGHTGSGKSTLMQHFNGLMLPDSGSVYYNGQDITDKDFPLKTLRQKVGLVFQYPEHQLFEETVEKDVCFGPENMGLPKLEVQQRAYDAIAAVGLPDTIYDSSPLQLSGGQKRRVAIAGVLAMQPEFLVLDEPTAGLDPQAGRELLNLLKKLQVEKGITIILVSHDMEQVCEYADRVLVMEDGELRLDGETAQVFSNGEQLKEMGLEVPVGLEMLFALKNVGNDMDIHACRMEDIKGEMMKLRNGI